MKKKLFQFLLFFIVSIAAKAQPFTIGEKIPDPVLKNIFNNKSSTLKLSQFNADLIILDFWSHICVACIHSFTKIDSLQKQFGGKLQFIAVNNESYGKTVEFFQKRKQIKIPAIPFVTGDTILKTYFPNTFVPWHVWIDKNLIVRYITFGHNATKENIQAFLDKKNPPMYQLVNLENKRDSLQFLKDYTYYSLITKAVRGADRNSDYGKIEENKVYLAEERAPAIGLIKMAIGGIYKKNFTSVDSLILETSDSNRLVRVPGRISKDDWEKEHLYNYYLMLPAERKKEIYSFMLQDIERYFNLIATYEKRKVWHLVMIRTNSIDHLKTLGGIQQDQLKINTLKIPVSDSLRFMSNMPFEKFVIRIKAWSQGFFQLPFLDETGYNGNIDINLDAKSLDAHNLELWRKELNKYGLDIIKTLREKDVLVIKDK